RPSNANAAAGDLSANMTCGILLPRQGRRTGPFAASGSSRMKRKLIRCAAILLGAALGWSAAGMLPINVTYAEDAAHDHAETSHDDHDAHAGGHDGHHDDPSADAA